MVCEMLYMIQINGEGFMREWSIVAVEISMTITGILMMCLMALTALS